MKKKISCILLFTFFLISFITTPSKAQDDSNAGIYIDGTFVDKIDCWTFDYMYMIFPISEKYKKYDKFYFNIYLSRAPHREYLSIYTFQIGFTTEQFYENFGDAKYGVWKFLRDKNLDTRVPLSYKRYGFPESSDNTAFRRSDFACQEEKKVGKYKGFPCSDYSISFEVLGATANGFTYDGNGNKILIYGNHSYLYKSEKIPVTTCKDCPWDINAACPVTGKKVDLKVEKSGAYLEHIGLIKGSGSSNSSSSTKNTQVKTTPAKVEVKTTTPTKTTATATSNASSTSSVKPLDKTKPNYFAEKNEDGKITREGYKKGEVMLGELRMYSDEGKLTTIYTYSNDEKNGPYAEYDPETGNILLSGQYKNGEKDGEWIRYNNGKKAGTDIYVNGEKQ